MMAKNAPQLYMRDEAGNYVPVPMAELEQAQFSFGWVCFIEGAMWQKMTKCPKVRVKLAQNKRLEAAYKALAESLE